MLLVMSSYCLHSNTALISYHQWIHIWVFICNSQYYWSKLFQQQTKTKKLGQQKCRNFFILQLLTTQLKYIKSTFKHLMFKSIFILRALSTWTQAYSAQSWHHKVKNNERVLMVSIPSSRISLFVQVCPECLKWIGAFPPSKVIKMVRNFTAFQHIPLTNFHLIFSPSPSDPIFSLPI